MSKKNPSRFPIVLIRWEDHTGRDDWVEADDLEESLSVGHVDSIGWLVKETDKHYIIAGGLTDPDRLYTSLQLILKGTVLSKTVIAK